MKQFSKYLDKETVLVAVIALAILTGWGIYYPKYQQDQARKAREQQELLRQENAKAKEIQKQIREQSALPAPPAQKKVAAVRKDVKQTVAPAKKVPSFQRQKTVVLRNKVTEITFDPNSGTVIKSILRSYKTSDRKNAIVFDGDQAPCRTGWIEGLENYKLTGVEVSPVRKDNTLQITRTFANAKSSFMLTQILTLKDNSYLLEMKYILANAGKTPVILPTLKIWNAGIPAQQYFGGDKLYSPMHRLDYVFHATGDLYSLDPAVKETKFLKADTEQPVDWIGSTNKYFGTLLIAKPHFDGGVQAKRRPHLIPGSKDGAFHYVPALCGIYKNIVIPVGGVKDFTLEYFAGPKTLSEVNKLPKSAIQILHISSFSLMEYIARPVLKLLNLLKDWCGSYGVAIILLTLLVRIIFFPLTEKGNRSMRKMQTIAPKAKEIREKYKDNPQLMNQKTMELYRQEGVNPLGGCLPILLQIPVFFALYAALDSAVELRHVSFLWAKDLTKPDLVGPAFLFGYGIHPLVLIMTALMILQQKMTPSNMDPAQQKMMMFMPVIMLVLLYNLPSGLTLYWTVSQIFSILQMKYSSFAAKREEAKKALEAPKQS